jgi:hypothetical protein
MVMNINGIGSASSTTAVDAISVNNVSTQNGGAAAVSTPAASAEISKPGELFSKLQQLAQQDPDKFKQIAGSIADNLRTAAQQAGGNGSSFLNKLADRFDQAAQSGDLSSFQPHQEEQGAGGVQGQHHHHGHHGGGGGGAIASIFENALDEVNQALGAGADPTAATTATDPTTATT